MSKPWAVYLIGVPGSGKSSVMRELVAALGELGEWRHLAKDEVGPLLQVQPVLDRHGAETGIVQLGRPPRRHELFPGTDTLSLAVKPPALRWAELAAKRADLRPAGLLGEGQRLGDGAFLERVGRWANLLVGYIDAPEDVLAARRLDRALDTGLPVPGTGFLKGARTKADNTAAHVADHGARLVSYDSSEASPREIADDLLDKLVWARMAP